MAEQLRIGFFGAGKMATAMARGLVKSGLVRPDGILASDPQEQARSAFEAETGARTTVSNSEVARFSPVSIIAVKPGLVSSVLGEIRDLIGPEHLLISIAAGVRLEKLSGGLKPGVRCVRVMPNTPALVGAGASAFAVDKGVQKTEVALVNAILTSIGLALEVPETWLDAVTGLSGSGPAYVFMMIEAMSDGGVAAGLPRDIAIRLAAQTVLGSAKMVLESGLHPGQLKDMVTSPGGTTIEGLHQLEKGAVRAALINAVRAASDRSRQLG